MKMRICITWYFMVYTDRLATTLILTGDMAWIPACQTIYCRLVKMDG